MAEGGIIIADVSVTPGRGIYTLKFVIQILGLLTVRDRSHFLRVATDGTVCLVICPSEVQSYTTTVKYKPATILVPSISGQ